VAGVVGLDIGGSKTAGVRLEAGQVVARAHAGSANVASVGDAEAGRQLDALLDSLGRDGIAAACAGAAGADSPATVRRVEALLAQLLPGAAVAVVHDAELILAAAGVEHGIALIAGTGSVAWGTRPDGARARAGGWGYALGDEGSGYWVGREAVRQALGELDRAEPPGPLARRLLAACGLSDPGELLDHFYSAPERRYWAERARVVFELPDDRDCMRISAEAAGALAHLVATVARRLGVAGPVVMAGGLVVHQPRLQGLVRQALAERGIVDVRVLEDPPVVGAARLAERLLAAPAVPGRASR
jgi:N-acetylglucosamine kinase-like BadF-type ATPase